LLTLPACGPVANPLSTTLPDDYLISGTVQLDSHGTAQIRFRAKDDHDFWSLVFGKNSIGFKGEVNGQVAAPVETNVIPFGLQADATLRFKLQAHGAELRAKWWLDTQEEAQGWYLHAVDNRILSGGLNVDPQSLLGTLSVSTCLEDAPIIQPINPETPPSSLPSPEVPAPFSVTVWTPPEPVIAPAAPAAAIPEKILASKNDELIITENKNTDQITVTVKDTSGKEVVLTAPLPAVPEEAHSIVTTYDGNQLNLYVDGALGATQNNVSINLTPADVAAPVSAAVEVAVAGSALPQSAIVEEYLAHQNNPPSLTITSARQEPDSTVMVDYTLKDAEANFIHLSAYDYSLTGAFGGEEKPMTLADDSAGSEDTTGLTSSVPGIPHRFLWDAKADLGQTLTPKVWMRLIPDDGLATGTPGTFIAALVAPPAQPSTPASPPNGGSSFRHYPNPDEPVPTESAPTDGSVAPSNSVSATSGSVSPPASSSSTQPFSISPPPRTPSPTIQKSLDALDSLQKTEESPLLALPEIHAVAQTTLGNTIHFEGKGIPHAHIALFIHSDQVAFYTTQVDADGHWSFEHSQADVTLSPGEHTVYAVTYDPGSRVKSKPTPLKTFLVTRDRFTMVLSYFDWPTTLLTLLTALAGLIFIYRRSRGNH